MVNFSPRITGWEYRPVIWAVDLLAPETFWSTQEDQAYAGMRSAVGYSEGKAGAGTDRDGYGQAMPMQDRGALPAPAQGVDGARGTGWLATTPKTMSAGIPS